MILRPSTRLLIPTPGVQVVQGRPSGVAAWYRAGGAPVPLGAYALKGAASQAAAQVNLVTPGTFDLFAGVAPTWNATDGLIFNGVDQYFRTGITPANDSYTYIIRTAGTPGVGNIPFGFLDSSKRSYIQINTTTQIVFANSDSGALVNVVGTDGVVAVSATDGYRNGTILTSAVGNWGAGTALEITIGALKRSGSITNFFTGTIQAFAIYPTSTDSTVWVPAVSAAMESL
jgi:hypothetical protein